MSPMKVAGKQYKPNYNTVMKDVLKIISHTPLDNELPSDISVPDAEEANGGGDMGADGGDGEPAEDPEDGGGGMDGAEDGEEGEDGFSFFLYTNVSQLEEDVMLTRSTLGLLNNSNPIKFIVHGWTENAKAPWIMKMTEAYLNRGNCNVIAVDWSKVSTEPYLVAMMGAKDVGQRIGKLIADIIEAYPENGMDYYHIIGHSMGAHVAAFAGKTVININGNKIGRITGLDPAGPLFDLPIVEPDEKFSADDAEFVDALHTDGGVFGYKEKLGSVDFYANGGSAMQPGCSFAGFETFMDDLFCSHHRSYEYFIESISSNKILAQECDSANTFELGLCSEYDKIIFGEDAPANASGNFFFYTNADAPYAKDEEADNTVDEETKDLEGEGGDGETGGEGMSHGDSGMEGGMPGGMPEGIPGMGAIPGASDIAGGINSIPGMDGNKLSVKMPSTNQFDKILQRLGLQSP